MKLLIFFLFHVFIKSSLSTEGIVARLWEKYDYCFHNGTRKIPPLSETQLARVSKLKQIQVLFRHGARTPLEDDEPHRSVCSRFSHSFNCPSIQEFTDPSLNFHFIPGERGNCMPGQLTDVGVDQLRLLGTDLRDGYFGNIPSKFNEEISPERVYAYSSWTERTRMSLQSLMKTLLPDISETPQAYSLPIHRRIMIPPPDCTVFNELSTLNITEDAFVEYMHDHGYNRQQLIDLVYTFNKDIHESPTVALDVFDCLSAKVCDGMTLPLQDLKYVPVYDMQYIERLSEMANVLNRFLVAEQADFAVRGLYGMINQKVDEIEDFPIVLWSGHDSTMSWVLSDLQLWDGIWPPFASALVWEIYEMQPLEKFNVGFRIVHNGRVLRLPGCDDDICPVEKLKDALSSGLSVEEFQLTCIDISDNIQPNVNGALQSLILTGNNRSWRFFLQFALGIALFSCVAYFCWQTESCAKTLFPYIPIPENTMNNL